MEIKGTKERQKSTDNYQKCRNKNCGRLFYYDRNSGKKVIVCPYCNQKH